MLSPLGNRILVEMDESLPNQAGILLAPNLEKWRDSQDQIGNRGTVVSIGPGKRHPKTDVRLPMMTKPGDIVRFSEAQYTQHKENGKTFALISEMDVVGVEESA